MEFFLPFKIDASPDPISYGDKILFIGSCFSEEIGDKLATLKFNVFQNPTGIAYHPLNIVDTLNMCLNKKEFSEKDLHRRNGLFHSWQHHSRYSSKDKAEVLSQINSKISDSYNFLINANYLIITASTAYAYYLIENNVLVANCHKAPASFFEKKLIDPDFITFKFSKCLSDLKKINPGIKLIFTISPVKHLRDGVINNQKSKASIIQAIHNICDNTPDSYYFPSFEIMNDELRDYRFYKNDFAHPNETAVNYIFERFMKACISPDSQVLSAAIKEILAGVNHRALFPESEQHGKFINSLLQKMNILENQYPLLNFNLEREKIRNHHIA